MGFFRGAFPSPKQRLAAAAPHIAGAAPSSFGVLPPKLQTWGNDQFGDCHSSDSEVLTSKGWVLWPDYDGETPLATMNPFSRRLEFQAPLAITQREHDGPMAFSDHKGLDFVVTPNHRMLYAPYKIPHWRNYQPGTAGYQEFRFGTIDEMPSRVLIPGTTSGFIGTDLKKVGVGLRTWDGTDFLRLLAVIAADGWVRSGVHRDRIEFCCFRDDRHEMVASLAYRLEIHRSARDGVWSFVDPALASWLRANLYVGSECDALNKHVPDLVKVASQDQISEFLEYFGDQSHSLGSRQFFSSSKRLADDLQELLLRVGKRGTLYEGRMRDGGLNQDGIRIKSTCPAYTLHEYRDGENLGISSASKPRWDHYKGDVFCATVPNSTLITRRNGRILISGNCVSAEEAASKAAFSVFRGQPELLIPNATIISWARQHGYLNGANLTDVMDSMIHDGIDIDGKNYKDGPYQSVDWTNYSTLSSAIFQGPVKIAVAAGQLESSGAGSKMGWIGNGWRRNKNTDHSVALWGYGTAQELADLMNKTLNLSVSLGNLSPQTPSTYLYTWATVGIVEFNSMVAVTDEAWLRSPTTVPDPGPPTPTPSPNPTRTGVIVIDLGSNSILAPAHVVLSPTATPIYSYDPAISTISGPDGLVLVPPLAGHVSDS